MNKKIIIGAAQMRAIAKSIDAQLPHGMGFVLLTFNFYETGIGNYITNAKKEDIIKHLRDTADRLENKEDFRTPEEN